MSDPYARLFAYRRGQQVRWAGGLQTPYRIAQRRWTERDILAPVVEYLLAPLKENGATNVWAYEPDIVPWEEEFPMPPS